MDVTRIEAVNPHQIDWRKLTANQIIKYETQGVEVPSQYLQWAREFLMDVEAAQKDEITYEAAMSNAAQITGDNPSTSTTPDNSQTEGTTPAEEPKTLTAKEKREQMEKDGKSLFVVARTFMNESDTRKTASVNGIDATESASASSDDEVATLESNMQALMSRCNDVRSQIAAEKNKKNNNIGTIQKLQDQLRAIGKEAQTMLLQGTMDLETYQQLFSAQGVVGLGAVDYGEETVNIGKEVKRDIYMYGYGKRVERSGEDAVKTGDELKQNTDIAATHNSSNIDKVNALKAQVEASSGVGALSSEESANAEANDNTTAAVTETDKAATASLDQILQAKIRKGESVNT